MIREEAAQEGISAAQFVREAALTRAIYTRTLRGHPDGEGYDEIIRRLREEDDA